MLAREALSGAWCGAMEQLVGPPVPDPGGGLPHRRYAAFLSYSHRNRKQAEWLHRALERYRIPKRLVGRETAKGRVPARLSPVFRDRDELSAADDLGTELRAALAASDHLVVLASPASARSLYVREEILAFKRMHGEGRVLALVVEGLPEESFPEPLKYRIGADGALTTDAAEPIAADMRPEGDGRRLAFLKIVAGMTGLRLDDLVQREAQRRARRMTMVAAGATAGMLLTSGLALYAERQRRVAVEQRQIAERESEKARAATDYLIGTFELVDPATENPRTVSLVTLLERGAERARVELRDQPEIEARLVASMGRAYNNLGLLDEAETAFSRALPAINRAGAEGIGALLVQSETQTRQGDLQRASMTLSKARALAATQETVSPAVEANLAAAMGRNLVALGRQEEALDAYDRALAILDSAPDPDPRARSLILNGRGNILSDLGRFEDAEASLVEANRIIREMNGETHLRTAESDYLLAQNAYLAGDLPLAATRIARAKRIFARMLDQSNPIRADALSLQGQILFGQERYAEARESLDGAIQAYEETLGRKHYMIGIAEVYRAMVAREMGAYPDALRHLDLARAHYDASYGSEHANHGDLLINRAQVLARAGRMDEARRDCRAGLAILDRTLGVTNNFTEGLRRTCSQMFASRS